MKTVAILLCVILGVKLVAAAARTDGISPRIVGGVSVRRNEFPHLCAIQLIRPVIPDTIVGAGSILSRRWIVTAATNLYANNLFQRSEVLCGRFDLSLNGEPTEQRMRIGATHAHPLFRLGTPSSHDIALIHLVSELHFTNNVQPIGLPATGSTPTGIATLIGWAGLDDSLLSQSLGILQFNRVAILPAATCNNFLAPFALQTNATHICTGPSTGGLSPCNEDRGSSLFQIVGGNRILVGIVSLPQACGAPGLVGTYTRVSEFITWINGLVSSN